MKPGNFTLHVPGSVAEATALLATLDNAKVIAGGQSLVAMMNFRYAVPDHLVDISHIAELRGIRCEAGEVEIGATALQRDLEFSAPLAEAAPLFAAALAHVGHRQTRNSGTIGGSLAHADPAAELPVVCLAHDASIAVQGPEGSRNVSMGEFGLGFMMTALAPDELLTAVRFEPWPAGHGYGFEEYARRHGDFAVVCVAVLLDVHGGVVRRASIALGGMGERPLRRPGAEAALVGALFDDVSIGRAAALAADVAEAVDDVHGTAVYRRHLARTLTARALRAAGGRCHAETRTAA